MAKAVKTFTVHSNPDQAALLAEALTTYADAAYPPGGSDCAQVSHEALLTSARSIATQAAGQGAELSRRQRVMIRAAVAWYFSDQGPGDAGLQAQMLALLPGGRVKA